MKKVWFINFLVLTVLIIASSACSTISSTETLPPSSVPTATLQVPSIPEEPIMQDPVGVVWRLVTLVDQKGNQLNVLPESRITIEFSTDQINGIAGCNHYFASYQREENRLTFSNAGITEMFCVAPDGVMEQEGEYLGAVQQVRTFAVHDNRMQMFGEDGSSLLVFTAEEPHELAGTAWKMIFYFDGKSGFVSALQGTEVSANFAPDGNLSGSAGCNQFNSQYRVDGDRLEISAINSTMMLCEQPEGLMEQENAYLSALSNSASFQIDRDRLDVFDETGMRVLSFLAVLIPSQQDSVARSNVLESDRLLNMTYMSSWTSSGKASLKNGEYREPAAPGSASEVIVSLVRPIAYGSLENGKDAAAVVLATSTGGSGTFFDLALVMDLDTQSVHYSSVFLGDRVLINSISLEGGAILVEMVNQGPEDAMCCPTQNVIQRYIIQGGELVLESSEIINYPANLKEIMDMQWMWVEFEEMNDELILVDIPEAYSLDFQPDGSLQVQADCNRISGTYTTMGSLLDIELGPTTMASCTPDSLDSEYLRLLSDVVSYVFEEGELYLAIKYDSGIMKFVPVRIP